MTDPSRLNFSQFAKLVGVTPHRISQAVSEGKLTVHVDPATGVRYLDGMEAQREWRENTDESKAIGPRVRDARRAAAVEGGGGDEDAVDGGFEVPSYNDSRKRLEHFKALTAEAAYREKVGELVEAEAVRREAFECARALREAILGVPDRLASELAAETDPNRIHARITDELVVALEATAARPMVVDHGADTDDDEDGSIEA